MRQFFIAFLILAAVVVGGSVVANVAYQAGLSTAVTTVAATAPEGTVVTPVVPGGVPAYGYGYGYGYGPGWGWHGGPGFGIFGFLFGLFFLFLLFGLIRAAFGGGRRWGGPGGWGGGGRGGWGNGDHGEHPWERAARDRHEAWHREQRGESSAGGASSTGGPTGASGA